MLTAARSRIAAALGAATSKSHIASVAAGRCTFGSVAGGDMKVVSRFSSFLRFIPVIIALTPKHSRLFQVFVGSANTALGDAICAKLGALSQCSVHVGI
jgi:hypothetical protein